VAVVISVAVVTAASVMTSVIVVKNGVSENVCVAVLIYVAVANVMTVALL
jgi:hypothetical protein